MWAISGIDGHPSNLVRAEGTERDVYMRVSDDEVWARLYYYCVLASCIMSEWAETVVSWLLLKIISSQWRILLKCYTTNETSILACVACVYILY